MRSADQFAKLRRKRPCVVAVIDDDESVRESVVGLIESVGHCVTFFRSAEEFLNSAEVNTVACMIVDVRLPGISGLDLFSQMRANQQSIPTIFITAHAVFASQPDLQEGAVDCLLKPFSETVLLEALKRALKLK